MVGAGSSPASAANFLVFGLGVDGNPPGIAAVAIIRGSFMRKPVTSGSPGPSHFSFLVLWGENEFKSQKPREQRGGDLLEDRT